MKMIKAHKILGFKQSDWLKKYIDCNTDKRKNAANSEKDFFSLMSNRVFGETMEKLRKRINVKLVNNAKDHVNCISKPIFFNRKYLVKFCCYS